VGNYSEARLFNGCLNRKISIDATGQIRNCPSMSKSFGFADEQRLAAVLEDADFLAAGRIRKDDIEVCRECEFRYICSDCRAYIEDPTNQLSKPLKCGYDPTTGVWEPWYRPAFKSVVREFYGIPLPMRAATRRPESGE
jgi:SPASM domain peptide maturase of grasp-with-spasm system